MSTPEPPDKFDMSVEPAPKTKVIDAEPADEEEKRRQDAAAASTYDQALAHDGKTNEELIEERHDAELAVAGAAIVGGIIIAHELSEVEHDADIDDAGPDDAGDGE
ncbi:hypothetical protein [Terricaulis sp.]|uniref:hypothetical protein n=1 Tax=Terricaulis sp. TaxID=2768686 RepID=UPI00378396E7